MNRRMKHSKRHHKERTDFYERGHLGYSLPWRSEFSFLTLQQKGLFRRPTRHPYCANNDCNKIFVVVAFANGRKISSVFSSISFRLRDEHKLDALFLHIHCNP